MTAAHNEYQQAEVDWYTRHGQHQDARISYDNRGQPYVIGDASWNRPGRPAEYVDNKMVAALVCKFAAQAKGGA